jgi:hypothetical protein
MALRILKVQDEIILSVVICKGAQIGTVREAEHDFHMLSLSLALRILKISRPFQQRQGQHVKIMFGFSNSSNLCSLGVYCLGINYA